MDEVKICDGSDFKIVQTNNRYLGPSKVCKCGAVMYHYTADVPMKPASEVASLQSLLTESERRHLDAASELALSRLACSRYEKALKAMPCCCGGDGGGHAYDCPKLIAERALHPTGTGEEAKCRLHEKCPETCREGAGN